MLLGCEIDGSLAIGKLDRCRQSVGVPTSGLQTDMDTKMTEDGVCHVAIYVTRLTTTIRAARF